MAQFGSQWTLIASEPDETHVYDPTKTVAAVTSKTGFRRHLQSLAEWRKSHDLSGWKFGVRLGLGVTFTCLLLNVFVTIYIYNKWGVDEMGKATLARSDCQSVKRWSLIYHLCLNCLSTLLIGASNYAGQTLSAPTRSEVDRAHSKGTWLDIGILSARNLGHINKTRIILFVTLAISSVPLHLFWNSAVFVTLAQHSYHVVEIAPNFLGPDVAAAYDSTQFHKPIASSPYSVFDLHQYATNHSRNLARVDVQKCIDEILVPMNTENMLYLLVTKGDANKPYNTSDLQYKRFVDTWHSIAYADCDEEPGIWACNQLNLESCTLCSSRKSELFANIEAWNPDGEDIDYCLNLRAQDQCSLDFSVSIMIIIIFMNAVKVVIFAILSFFFNEAPLVTLGDAIASFIKDPPSPIPSAVEPAADTSTRPAKSARRWAATTKRRWFYCILFLCLAEGLVIFFLIYAAIVTARGMSLFSIPFATVDPRAIIYAWGIPSVGASAVIANALIANIAQPVLSAIYFSFNGLITSMCAANEWNHYSLEKKGLRVSSSRSGEQRSTHALQLPYRYGVPLMVLSILTHWMVSQAIFVVSVVNDGHLNLGGIAMDYPYYCTCGYGPSAIIGVIVLGVSILVYAVCVGSIKMKSSDMPIAGSNSMLIARQCIIEEPKEGLEKVQLQWGIRRSVKSEHEWVAGFSDQPITDLPPYGGQKEMRPLSRKGYVSVMES